ncbi:MAG: N-acetylmuramoyl-L-alanine amidase [bacterium]|nr:N-acetylmuramoyl-L-alanine amidase [bacterium]
MTTTSRLKRQLLQEAVDDNIDSVRGQPLGTTRRVRTRRRSLARRTLLSCAAAVLVALTVAAWREFDRTPAGASNTSTEPQLTLVAPVNNLRSDRFTDQPKPLEPSVIPLSVRRIVVDPGHGGKDGGTSPSRGLSEKNLTLDIGLRLRRLLEASTYEVVMTRTSDETVSLRERADLANDSRADLFLSIHVNWLPDRNARGVETYFAGPTDDPFLKQLAAAENRDAGYSVSDYKRLLEGVYADVRRDESATLADGLQQTLFRTLKKDNPSIVGRGVMRAPFVVLVATEMPAVLAEVACISNAREARLLAQPSYRQKIAEALFEGIESYSQHVNPHITIAEKGAQHD